MGNVVAPRGGLPLYVQARIALERLIKSGQLKPGQRLPSENELRAEYGLSSTTVRRALLDLQKDGLIYRHAGLGTFVARQERAARLLLVIAGYDATALRKRGGEIVGQIIGGVSQTAWEHDAIVSMMHVPADMPLQALLSSIIAERSFDGVMLRIAGDVDAADLDFLEGERFPYVVVRRSLPGREMNCVTSDYEAEGSMATSHLISLARRRIALILGPRSMCLFRGREQGYLRALETAGRQPEPSLIRSAADFQEQDGYLETKALFASTSPPDAIFASNNLLCIGAYTALRELRLRIPDDVAVVACDGAYDADKLIPPLTAVTTPLYDVGVESAKLLLDMIEHGQLLRRTVFVESTLVVRESSGGRPTHSQQVPALV